MKRITIIASLAASLLAIALVPTISSAERHHSHHRHHRGTQSRLEHFGTSNPTAPSSGDAGTITSFTGGVLMIKLTDGSSVTNSPDGSTTFKGADGSASTLNNDGSGGGQGSDPIAKPSGHPLQIQVIAQQWAFTYRFPSFGGVETAHLELPVDRSVELHVTSLDAIHSFWAHDLGVKADANPGVDNVAYVRPTETRSFSIHCAELCGLWHGHMFDTGEVVSDGAFLAWIRGQQRVFAPATGQLPPYRPQYNPDPQRRAG